MEIRIKLQLDARQTLHKVLRMFARASKHWKFPPKESADYQTAIGSPAGYVVCGLAKHSIQGLVPAAVAVASLPDTQPPCCFGVPNIVPLQCGALTLDQYNAIAAAFARAFRNWLRSSSLVGSVHCSNPTKTLSDIIPGKKCRAYFERYLRSSIWDSTILPSHPADVERLDVFICALFRYGASVRSHEIENYLATDRKWKPADAAWVRARIDTGMEVLRMNRRFG